MHGQTLVTALAGWSRTAERVQTAGQRPLGVVEGPPQLLKGGGESHSARVGVDWLTLVGDRQAFDRAVSWCSGWWGAPRETYGINMFRKSYRWPTGAILAFEPVGSERRNSWWCLNLPGSVMGEFNGDEQRTLLLDLNGFCERATRVDVYLDLMGERLGTIDVFKEACAGGEMVGFKQWHEDKRLWASGRVVGHSLYMGTRQGHLMVRVYDKGLESKTKPQGCWVRIEAEYRREKAEVVWHLLLSAARGGGEVQRVKGIEYRGFDECVAAVIGGCMEFREARQGVSRLLCRRRISRFWSEFVEWLGRVRVKSAVRVQGHLNATLLWFRRSVFPTLRGMAEVAGVSLEELLAEVGFWAVAPARESPSVLQLSSLLGRGGRVAVPG